MKRHSFSPTVEQVYSTDNMLTMFKNDNYMDSTTTALSDVLYASHTLHRLYCDRDRAYFNKKPRVLQKNRKSSMGCLVATSGGAGSKEPAAGQQEEDQECKLKTPNEEARTQGVQHMMAKYQS